MNGAADHDTDRIRSLLEAYVLGEMTEDERREVSEHLSASPELRREHERIAGLVAAARSEPLPTRSLAYERRKRALLERVSAQSRPARESALARTTLGVVSTAAYLRARFRTSARFRFLVICAGAQAALILILVFGVMPRKGPRRSAPDRWDHVVVDRSRGLVEDPIEDDVPDAPGPAQRRRIPLAPALARGVPDAATWGGLGDAFARGDVDPRSLEIFRGELHAARSDAVRRMGLVFRRGGSLETEDAVKRGLKWLAGRQRDDGMFGAAQEGAETSVGTTSLAMLAFLGHGLADADRRAVVRRGLEGLTRRQGGDGFIGADPKQGDGPARNDLFHALATQALLEGVVMGAEGFSRSDLERAVRRLESTALSSAAVVTQTGLTLLMARNLGFPVSEDQVNRRLVWFDASEASGKAGPTAVSTLVYQAGRTLLEELSGRRPEAVAMVQGLFERRPDAELSGDPLGWLFASQALVRGKSVDKGDWSAWNRSLVDAVTARQAKSGGFFSRARDAAADDRSTAFGVLLLQVYYRFGAL